MGFTLTPLCSSYDSKGIVAELPMSCRSLPTDATRRVHRLQALMRNASAESLYETMRWSGRFRRASRDNKIGRRGVAALRE